MINPKYARSTGPLSFHLNRYWINERSYSKERAEDNKFIESIKDVLLGKGSWAKRLIRATELMGTSPQSDYVYNTLKDISEIVRANHSLNKSHRDSQVYSDFFSRFKYSRDTDESMFGKLAKARIIDPNAWTSKTETYNGISPDNLVSLVSFALAPEAQIKKREIDETRPYDSEKGPFKLVAPAARVARRALAASIGLIGILSSLSFTPAHTNSLESQNIQETTLPVTSATHAEFIK